MKALVTGGEGFIGSRLCEALSKGGHGLRILDLQPARRKGLLRGAEYVQGSMADEDCAVRAVQGVDVVFHLAWGFYTCNEREELQANLLGTLNLLSAALEARVSHFVFASSAVVYGPTGHSRASESHACRPERSTLGGSLYGLGKWAAERLCLVYHRRGLPATAFRMHGVFGPQQLGQFDEMIRKALTHEALRVNPAAGGEYAHIDDIVGAYVWAAHNRRAFGQIFNLAGTYTYHDHELAQGIVRLAGSRSPIEWAEEPTQAMISVSVEKVGRYGYSPCKGEFLTSLIRDAVHSRGDR